MKWWTAEWLARDDVTNDDFQTLAARYEKHLESLRGVLPAPVFDLALLRGVDDGLIVSIRRDAKARALTLTLRCGDLQMGYFDLVLRYENFGISPEHERTLAKLARATKNVQVHPDVAYHEIDVTPNGQIEHRFLFHPPFPFHQGGQWFALCANKIVWETVPQPNRDLPGSDDRFPAAPPFASRAYEAR